MKKQLILFLMILITIANFSCRDNPVGPDNGDLHLSAEDVGVTDLFLRVKITPCSEPRMLTLTRDGQTLLATQYTKLDTLILCDSLLPRHTYKYTAILTGKDIFSTTTAGLSVTTLDTTSHNFTWLVDTLGDGANSSLRDVTIVNDTCVVVVGEIHIRDSSGNWDPKLYNLALWNGAAWQLHEITFPTYGFGCTFSGYSPGAIRTIFSIGQRTVLVSDGVQIAKWDVDTVIYYPCIDPFQMLSGEILKIWGTSEENFYAVGRNGTIIHYNSGAWQKMESNTDVDLLDVWGSQDGSIIWACGWEDFKPTVLLRLRNGMWETVFEDPFPFITREDSLSGILTSIWSSDKLKLFILTDIALYLTTSNSQTYAKRIQFPSTWSGFPRRLRGSGVNDLSIVGEYNMIAHYNGVTWKHFTQFANQEGRVRSVAQRNNFVVVVGYNYDPINSRGSVFRGRR